MGLTLTQCPLGISIRHSTGPVLPPTQGDRWSYPPILQSRKLSLREAKNHCQNCTVSSRAGSSPSLFPTGIHVLSLIYHFTFPGNQSLGEACVLFHNIKLETHCTANDLRSPAVLKKNVNGSPETMSSLCGGHIWWLKMFLSLSYTFPQGQIGIKDQFFILEKVGKD